MAGIDICRCPLPSVHLWHVVLHDSWYSRYHGRIVGVPSRPPTPLVRSLLCFFEIYADGSRVEANGKHYMAGGYVSLYCFGAQRIHTLY